MAVRPIDADEFERELLCDMALRGEQLSGDAAYNRALVILTQIPTLTPQNEPLTCEGCACESYPRDCYPCNTCNRNDETLSDQYRPPEGEGNA